MRGRVGARKIRSVLQLAQTHGMDVQAFQRHHGITDETLRDPDAMLPQDLWKDAWHAVVTHTGRAAIGLQAAQAIARGYYGTIDYVIRTQPTIGDAVKASLRYFPLANTHGHIHLRWEVDQVIVSRHIRGDERCELPLQAAEFALMSMVRTLRLAAARDWKPTAIRFRHARTPHAEATARAFRCPVVYQQTEDAIVVSSSVLDIPTRSPDPELRSIVTRHADEALARLHPGDDFEARLRDAIARDLEGGPSGIDDVARRLGTSRRTLQRRLTHRGLVFRDVRTQVQIDLAERFLCSSELSIGEIAWLTGYAQVSGFCRAYKRWTGTSPQQRRRDGAQPVRQGTPGPHGMSIVPNP